ncbi:MAG TPA: hypothetical protein VK030_02285 [Actinomycetales bacterium]|nr:hypothetical protein [Actinomycetales bacterium]
MLALSAGVDVELPSVEAYGAPLIAEVETGRIGEDIIDQAVLRVLTQKAQLGLLDAQPKLTTGDQSPTTFNTPEADCLRRSCSRR